MTITLSTFKATRGNLQSYGDPSAVLKVMVLDETVIDNEDELVVKVTDLSSEVTGGTYAATTLTGVDWDLTGDQPALRADDVTIEGLDLPGPSPLPRYYVVFCDDHDDSDRIDDLVAILESTPAPVVGDQPIQWPGGIIATQEVGAASIPTPSGHAGEFLASDGTDALWVQGQSDAVPQPVGTAAAGTDSGMARGDHVHAADAAAVTYTAADSANWSGADPATIADALDRLADAVSASGATPIP